MNEVLPLIELQNVAIYHNQDVFKSPRFGDSDPDNDMILSDVNITVKRGELVFLIGKVGSGKSSLLRVLYGEVPLTHGEGRVAGINLKNLKQSQIPYLRRKLGVVFQDFQLLYDRNVYENLRFVLKATGWKNEAQIEHRIKELLNHVDLAHKIHKMPYQLSGGQQQRLCIARALLNSPEIILADEPTGNLDPASAREVMDLFAGIRDMGCAVVIATHNVANLKNYESRALKFDSGRIEELDLNAIFGKK